MFKRLISFVLSFAMVMLMVPFTVYAEETAAEPENNINEATGREAGAPGDEDVAVIVYGKSMTEAIAESNYDFGKFQAALKRELQGVLANEKLPEAEMYLVNDQNQEYKLTKNAVSDAAFLSSFKYEATGLAKWTQYIFKWIQDAFGWAISSVDTIGEFYCIYGATDVPEGDYTLEVRSINGDGYTLSKPYEGNVRVHVGDDHVNYVGYEQNLGSWDFDIHLDFGLFDIDWEVLSVAFSLPGIFMNTVDPGFRFVSADLGGNPLPGTEFMLINRDETVRIIKAAYALGKDTFTNAMNLIGTEGYTWEDLSILYNEALRWDEETNQITFNDKNAYKLLQTYWALIQASALDPMITFMSDETDIRLPAILRTTSDQNGIVSFKESDNVTLLWSLEILLRMGNMVLNEFSDTDLDALNYPDPQTKAIVRLVFSLAKYGAAKGVEFWDENGQLIEDVINDWVYPILRNDNAMKFAKDALVWFIGEDSLTEEDWKMLELLPTHAILTPMMPSGTYIMLETGVPDGYIHSPMFYTIYLTWNTEDPNPGRWCYATVGNLGIILPYFAEDYYSYLRNLNVPAEADKVLNLITDGRTGTLIQDTISNSIDVTALSIAYYANLAYNYMGGKYVYDSETELAKALTEYLYTYGRTAQNLLMFGDQLARQARAVVTSVIDENWIFYNFSTSIRTNIALQSQSMLRDFAASIDTSGNSLIAQTVKDTAEKIADNIDTSNHIIEQTTKIQNAVKTAVEETARTVGQSVFNQIMKFGKRVFSWWLNDK